jgi:hypothetical protein
MGRRTAVKKWRSAQEQLAAGHAVATDLGPQRSRVLVPFGVRVNWRAARVLLAAGATPPESVSPTPLSCTSSRG